MPPNFFMIPGNPGLSTHYNALVPGSSIPEWFIHLSEECSVTVELPPHCHICLDLIWSSATPTLFKLRFSGLIIQATRLSSNHSSSKFVMASSSTSLSVASSSSTHPRKYEVFLSFRGEDTRKSFTDHLHEALHRCGINTFIDDQLRRGEQISSALLQAIEESRFSIIIFSEHYASSSWCLDELTKILECVKVGGHTAFPVFYNVDPSHVRKQTGSYGVAFTKHEQVYRDNMEKVLKWREALTVASGLSGWDSRDRHESKVIKEIVSKIWNELNDASSCNMEALVGMDSHIQNMVSLLCVGSDDVRMVGIWGMAGIGKTTIAEAVYQKIHTQFEGNLNTRIFNRGINAIKKTLHSMRVLIVLDDVDCPQQLEVLAGNHNWFGPGSRIIITTREKHLLDEKVEIYEVKELNKDEARKLFYQHAFKYKPPAGDFGTEAVEGMVLNLSTLKELHFSVNVFTKMNKLRVLRFYDAQIWGSSWIWRRNDRYKSPYTECKFHLSGDFKFLSNHLRSLYWDGYPLKSLPSNFHPEKLLELKMCFSQLEQLWEGNKPLSHLIKTPDFSGAPKLRRIILEGCTSLVKVHPSIGALKKLIFLNLEGCKNLKSFLSSIHLESLQILTLSGCSKLKKFPEVQGAMDNLSELSLKGTAIKGLPLSIEYLNGLALLNLEECKSLESLPGCIFKLKSLKTLILSNCFRLKKLPEIQENMENLKELFLDDTGLRELPSSIEHLNGLVLLKLKNCKRLASLPESICKLTSLQTLTLSGCSELKKLPDDMGSLQCLLKLKANGSGIQEVPSSITLLTKLQVLSLAGCKRGGSKSRNLALSLRASPTDGLRLSSLTVLHSLKKLNLSDRNLLEGALPSDLSSLSWLECLDLSRNNFITVPTSLRRLLHLRRLIVEHCKNLQSLPELPSSIKELLANDCTSLETFSGNEQSDTVEAILQEIRLVASIQKSMAPSEHSARYGESRYDAVVPGSSIPEWFTHQSEGDSITVELPPGCYNTNSIGLAACAVFHPKFSMGKIGRSAYFSVNESGGFSLDNTTSMHFSKADHIWFGYRLISGVDLRDHLKVAFATSKVPGEVVKKCGVRLVYEQDEMGNASFLSAPCGREKEMNQIQSQETDTAASFSKLPPVVIHDESCSYIAFPSRSNARCNQAIVAVANK
ncbi:TMV resistance protein N [Vitis vinifera]|uniref:ADP-ribosyl cyclase/cyclic ADP-ribose hydrolase n=1 Tax=Vitis vinifera TaxID=29760 RepID=A0A438D3B4_VITVI|nr:TMV resistance protein N [Vitis vinifera]